MKESDLNTIIKKSLDWAHKIQDLPGSMAAMANQSPFDGFGRMGNTAVFWESKFSKKLGVFDLSKIAEHQANALDECAKIAGAETWAVYGIHVGRGDFRIWIFDWKSIKPRRDAKKNVMKKELVELPFHKVSKGLITIDKDMIIRDV